MFVLAATGTDDAVAEVNAAIRDAFGELMGIVLVLGLVVLVGQVAIRFVPRPAKPLAQLAGLGAIALTTFALVT